MDSRSYQASRRARELTREQYEAALTQETQAFTLADADAAGGGYPGGASPPRQPGGHRPNGHRPDTRDGYDGYGPTAAYPYAQTSDSERSGYPAGSGSRPPRSRGPRGPERR